MLAGAPSAARDTALRLAADLLEARTVELLEHNGADVARARSEGATCRQLDRLRLTDGRGSRGWPTDCAGWRPCPTRWARWSKGGCAPTGCA